MWFAEFSNLSHDNTRVLVVEIDLAETSKGCARHLLRTRVAPEAHLRNSTICKQ